jgi:DNA/RNA endonuclease YhcR with UshA esterase domain
VIYKLAVAVLLLACTATSQPKLTAAEAKDHIGKRATVCGVVASANFAQRSRRSPTFLNLDQPYPKHIFTAVIWLEDRPKFGQPEVALKGKKICVTGTIADYQNKPEIVLREKNQLTTE